MNFTEYLELHEKTGGTFNQTATTVKQKIAINNKAKEIATNEKLSALEAKKAGDSEKKAKVAEKQGDEKKTQSYRNRSALHAKKSREHQAKQIANRPVGSETYNVKSTPHRLAKKFDQDVKTGQGREELAKRALTQQESVRMTFTDYLEYLDSAVPPLYQVEGKLPQCPPGYVWNADRKDCLPKTEKDKINGKLNDKNGAYSGAHYNVWGKTGLNGDGYAYEDPPGTDINSSHWDKGVH